MDGLLEKQRVQWEVLASAGAVIATILGVVVPLFIHIDNRTDKKIEAIRLDIKDFHGKLCAIEERYRMEKK
jgi:hypothetical protein